ncbi:SMI1/KNR4 family protein [Cerasicoccus arenae]|uniref:Knr4/Smi1-like domain-containing protein n=1 Tax=Cerasicoccus arenae TaxID=424488 RepID=A0A8J3GEF3_9BACT|nr:SMI1/KNR4 family protein [Cerasicoccus arenae]MBK1860070.1 SMI1/KNR4 family protein [Cerasicoccus arenae]GHC14089.1 hypothetical protein GCM10007047_34190 [Cerasicoccus arenae]
MRKLSMRDEYGSCSSSVVDSIEGRLGIRFPADYREFLYEMNGGYLEQENDSFYDAVGHIDQLPVDVMELYGVGAGERASELVDTIKLYRNRIPDCMIPVGSDSFGNQICLVTTQEDFGKIYLWIHDEVGQGQHDSLVYLISNSFTDFVDGLTEYRD